jgi:flagellar basal-body rod protein FlgB
MTDLAILKLATGLARHSADRHALVAENIANADTPGFRAQDLRPFSELVGKPREAMRATRPEHLGGAGGKVWEAEFVTAADATSPNGNDVALGDQMTRATQAMGAHDRAMAVYGKTLAILKLGLGRGR